MMHKKAIRQLIKNRLHVLVNVSLCFGCLSLLTVLLQTNSNLQPHITSTFHHMELGNKAANQPLKIHFIDVGQGDATLIEYEDFHILIDAGDNGYEKKVISYLKKQKVDNIELLIATHPDVDHIGGMEEILTAYDAHLIIDAGINHTSKTFRRYHQALKNQLKQGALYLMAEPLKLQIAPNVTFEILPTKETYNTRNNHSVISKLSYGDMSVLFMADAEIEVEHELLDDEIAADILKVGHHGSLTSTTPHFLTKVNPSVAIISVGKENPYGHPHRCVLKRLNKEDIDVYTTAKDGTIVIELTDSTYEIYF